FSGDVGGGPYDRTAAVRAASATFAIDLSPVAGSRGFFSRDVWQVGVSHLLPDDGSGTLFGSLRDAVAAWNLQPLGRTGLIVVMASLYDHAEGGGAGPIEIDIGERSKLRIVAGEWPLEPIPGAPPGSVRRVPGHFDAQQVRAHVVGSLSV